jgi:hypothetical protein
VTGSPSDQVRSSSVMVTCVPSSLNSTVSARSASATRSTVPVDPSYAMSGSYSERIMAELCEVILPAVASGTSQLGVALAGKA